MTNNQQVFKFGGASIKDAPAIINVGEILKTYASETILIVISAIGKTTNALERLVDAHAKQDGTAIELWEAIKQDHYQILHDLLKDQNYEAFVSLNDAFVEVEWILEEEPYENYDYLYDQIIPIGELAASIIVAAYLNHIGLSTHWTDARDVILTDDIFREGWVQWEETKLRYDVNVAPLLAQGGFVLTQGFIASTTENFSITLGREGSDYTAAIFSFCMDAERMTIWKDVPGVLTADPRVFNDVIKLDRLSYREAIEMTYYGSKVIHPKTIKPLQNKNIPLHVKSFLDPSGAGTIISSEVIDNYPPIVALENEQALLQIATKDFSFVAEHHLSNLMQKIANLRLQVNLMQNTAISFNVCVNDTDNKVDRFVEDISDEFNVTMERNLELITIRHYNQATLDSLRGDKMVLVEERIKGTVQMVVKSVPILKRKA
ncbi:MAG: aspartate kinase [Saprospiraceae bacterium]